MIKTVDVDRGDMLGVYYKGRLVCRLAVTLIEGEDYLVVDEHIQELGSLTGRWARRWFERRLDEGGDC